MQEIIRSDINLVKLRELYTLLPRHGSGTKGSCAMIAFSNALARLATSMPTRPDRLCPASCAQLRPLQDFFSTCRPRGGIRAREMARQRQHQRQGMLGHGHGVGARVFITAIPAW